MRNCTEFTSCIDSYADIYNSLTSEDNSFIIESALYPALKPSSLVVKVHIYGPNLASVANYTWSMNCLYVAFPVEALQLLSFGSILVSSRTQDLQICIPDFCRNFSSKKGKKKPFERPSSCGKCSHSSSISDTQHVFHSIRSVYYREDLTGPLFCQIRLKYIVLSYKGPSTQAILKFECNFNSSV